MARRFDSRAEYYRHHRKCFEAALEWGCTPAEAEVRLRAIELRERVRAREDARKRREEARRTQVSGSGRDFERFDAPWMMRN
ncbi:MAG: hypothetical protein AAFQ13_06090 [Pseudomonadota bacterium]